MYFDANLLYGIQLGYALGALTVFILWIAVELINRSTKK